jgi:hypothetical protein
VKTRGAPPGFVREESANAITLVRAELADDARALGLFDSDAIARALASGKPLAGGRGAAAALSQRIAARVGSVPNSWDIVMRQLRHGGWLAPILRTSHWGAARVLGELEATLALFDAGAPVPAPALVLARRRAGPLWECAIGTQRLPGVTLLALLRDEPSGARRSAALRACAEAARAFHDRGGRHADLNATNVLVHAEGAAARAWLIDLDRARVARFVPPRRRAREIARLWRSLAKHAGAQAFGVRDRDAFVAHYCAGDAALERTLRAHLQRERARTALHALRYRRR